MKQKAFSDRTVQYSFVRSLPVMAGYVVLGFGFGILLAAKGYGVLWALFMSVIIFAGSMQYISIGLLASGAPLISAALITLMVNARHLFYGLSLIDRYSHLGRKKPYTIFALTDETYSLVCTEVVPADVDENRYYFLLSLFNHSYWVIGSVLGGAAGTLLSFNSAGIDFSMTALFIVSFTGQWLSTIDHRSAIAGLGISAACVLIFGPSNFLIPTMIGILAVLLVSRRSLEKTSGTANASGSASSVSNETSAAGYKPNLSDWAVLAGITAATVALLVLVNFLIFLIGDFLPASLDAVVSGSASGPHGPTSAAVLILVVAAVTALTRFLPFLVFGNHRKTPEWLTYLTKVLPFAIIAMLVVYCLREIDPLHGTHALPELISVVCVVAMHVWKRNTLLSIAGGTAIYMFLVQMVF